jgi:hypothetical protein
MPKKIEYVNFYEKKDIKKYLLNKHNPNYDLHHIVLPFRMLIIGCSGSGKTHTFVNLLKVFSKTFQNIHVITKNKQEPLYQYLEEKIGKKGLIISEGISSLPDLDDYNKDEQSLIVLDDLVLEKNQKRITEYFIRCRKLNISVIYISQDYYSVDKMIRRNLNYLIIKQVSSLRDLRLIMSEYSIGLDKEEMERLYKYCTSDKDIGSFLFIDMEDRRYRFRKGFYELLQVKDEF